MFFSFFFQNVFLVRLIFDYVPTLLGEAPLPKGREYWRDCAPLLSAYPVPPYTTSLPWLVPFPFSSQKPHPGPHPMLPHTSHMHKDLSFIPSGICSISHLISLAVLHTSPCLLPSRGGNTNPGTHKCWVSWVWSKHRDTGLATSLCWFRVLFSMHGASARRLSIVVIEVSPSTELLNGLDSSFLEKSTLSGFMRNWQIAASRTNIFESCEWLKISEQNNLFRSL